MRNGRSMYPFVSILMLILSMYMCKQDMRVMESFMYCMLSIFKLEKNLWTPTETCLHSETFNLVNSDIKFINALLLFTL